MSGELPPDGHLDTDNPFTSAFVDHFPNLMTRAAACGHFVPEEEPERTTSCIAELLGTPGRTGGYHTA